MAQTIDLRKKPQQTPPLSERPNSPETPTPEPELFHNVSKPEPTRPQAIETATPGAAVSWETAIERQPAKQTAWFTAIILAAIGALVFFFSYNLLFIIALGLGAAVIILRTYAHYPVRHITVTGSHIAVDDQVYLFSEMKSFWIDYRPRQAKDLHVEFKKLYRQPLRIPLIDANPLEIRANMVQYIAEKEYVPTILDHIVQLLGF